MSPTDASSSSAFLSSPLTQQPSPRSPHWLVYPLLGNSSLLRQVDNADLQEHLLFFHRSAVSDSMTPSTAAHLPVLHYLPELTQTQVHWVSDAIQPSLPLLPSSPPAFNLSQHQGLFQCQLFTSGSQSTGASASASVPPMNVQGWFPLVWLVGSPCCPRDSQECSPTPQFKSISSLALRLHYAPTLVWDPQNLFKLLVVVIAVFFSREKESF